MPRNSEFHMCQWVSTKPGSTIMPRPSITVAPPASTFSSTLTISPLRTWTWPSGISPMPFSIDIT
jgi:hypothetical protein